MRPRPISAVAGLGVVAWVLGGCASETYRVTMHMGARSTVTVRVVGEGPMAVVENLGPGPVRVTFDDLDDASADPVAPGTARGRTLHGTKTVRLATGDEPADVRVVASRASGLAIDGP